MKIQLANINDSGNISYLMLKQPGENAAKMKSG